MGYSYLTNLCIDKGSFFISHLAVPESAWTIVNKTALVAWWYSRFIYLFRPRRSGDALKLSLQLFGKFFWRLTSSALISGNALIFFIWWDALISWNMIVSWRDAIWRMLGLDLSTRAISNVVEDFIPELKISFYDFEPQTLPHK